METCIVGGDLHIPFHSHRSINKFLDLVKSEKPSTVIINGDILDCYLLSKFRKLPSKTGMKEEIRMARDFWKRLRGIAPQAKLIWVWGNHDLRPELRVLESVPNAFDLLDIERKLNLEEFGVIHVHDILKENCYQWHDTLVGHFDKALPNAGSTAMSLLGSNQRPIGQSHTHRLALVFKTSDVKTLWAAECGCLCQTRPRYQRLADWQNGCLIIRWDGRRSWPELRWFR